MARPLIGITLDSEQPGGWSHFPWYALRANYTDAVAAAGIAGREDGRHRFCLGLQWHPECLIDPGDRRGFDAFVAAAS